MATLDKPKDDKKPKANQKTAGKQDASGGNVVEYLKGVRSEWGKITWPTVPDILRQTVVVLVMTTVMTLILLVIDSTFRFLIHTLLSVTGHAVE